MRIIVLTLFAFFASFFAAQAAESELIDTGKVNARLVASHDVVAPGETFHIALQTILDPKWHTYWRNPGDSGEPVEITWGLPDNTTAGEIIWPLPSPVPTGPIINYGFEDVALFPVPFKLSETARPGDELTITADVYYLVCKDICIPERGDLKIHLTVGDTIIHRRWDESIKFAISKSPKPANFPAAIQKSNQIELTFTDLPQGDFKDAYFFPHTPGVIDHSAPQTVTVTDKGLHIATLPGYGWEDGANPNNYDGVLKFIRGSENVGMELSLMPDTRLDVGNVGNMAVTPSKASNIGLWSALIGAFLGGLVLNLMPCVFPVISIKALSITKAAHGERSVIRREAWVYTMGVLATFLILTALLLALKSSGLDMGWGYQLQSPQVVGLLAVVLFAIGLNLMSVFEIGGSFQNTGQSLTEKSGLWGTFFTGVLAVIVATPCTAPFMAGAIGYAFTQPALVTLIIFTALAIGFALPFLLIAYIPALTRLMPKPGDWMVRFKELLAFPMFAAAIWLVWVTAQQAGDRGLIWVLAAMLLLTFGIWLARRPSAITKILAATAFIGSAALPLSLHPSEVAMTSHEQAWSPQAVQELRADGHSVFVDFTAAWCVTCKVNERLVLNTDEARELFAKNNVAVLMADWTNKNDEIAQELARHGRSGVPLYLLYPAGQDAVSPEILPQILTHDILREKVGALSP